MGALETSALPGVAMASVFIIGPGKKGVHTSCVHSLAGMNGNPFGVTDAGFYSTTGPSSEGEVSLAEKGPLEKGECD